MAMQIKGGNMTKCFAFPAFIIFPREKQVNKEQKENKRRLAGKSEKIPGIFNKGMIETGVLPSTFIQVKKGQPSPTMDASLKVICSRLIKFLC